MRKPFSTSLDTKNILMLNLLSAIECRPVNDILEEIITEYFKRKNIKQEIDKI